MTENQEKLLLKDLSSRLPYGVKLQVSSWDDEKMEYVDKVDTLYSISSDNHVRTSSEDRDFYIDEVKPYLFPMSSMTETQKNEYNYWQHHILISRCGWGDNDDEELWESPASFEYLIENHFDDKGFIERGLAIDATGLGIY